uniref:Uncharacterized protein n=1 Tax=Tetranychus urticae TaxID=32264 RepID=T1KN78_TETUR
MRLSQHWKVSTLVWVKDVRWSRFSDEGGGNGLLTTKNGDLMTLEIVFGRKPNMEAFTDDLDASISIHQSNELPLSSQKISKLKPGYNYLITFDKIIEKRMPPPFRTGCDQYKQTMNGNNEQVNTGKLVDERNFMGIVSPHLKPPQSKYDCVDQCLLTLYRQTCNCLPSDINVRRDLLRSNDTFCTNAKCQTLQIHRAEFCATLPRCKPNCEDELYNFEFTITSTLKNIEPHQDQSIITTAELVIFQGQWFQTEAGTYHGSLSESVPDIVNVLGTLSKAFVTVRKSSGPDVVYEHRPQYNYFDFVFQLMTLACVCL